MAAEALAFAAAVAVAVALPSQLALTSAFLRTCHVPAQKWTARLACGEG